jgi:hypothetical protein
VTRGAFDNVVVDVREFASVTVIVVLVVGRRRGVSPLLEHAFALVHSNATVVGFLGFICPVFPLSVLIFVRGMHALTSAGFLVFASLFLSLIFELSVSMSFIACVSLGFPCCVFVIGITAMFGRV